MRKTLLPFLLLLVSWQVQSGEEMACNTTNVNLQKIYEELCYAKQNGCSPKIECETYALEDSLEKTLSKILHVPTVQQIWKSKEPGVFQTGNQIIKAYSSVNFQEC